MYNRLFCVQNYNGGSLKLVLYFYFKKQSGPHRKKYIKNTENDILNIFSAYYTSIHYLPESKYSFILDRFHNFVERAPPKRWATYVLNFPQEGKIRLPKRFKTIPLLI